MKSYFGAKNVRGAVCRSRLRGCPFLGSPFAGRLRLKHVRGAVRRSRLRGSPLLRLPCVRGSCPPQRTEGLSPPSAPLTQGSCPPQRTEGLSLPLLPLRRPLAAEECKGSCLPQQTEGFPFLRLPFAGRKAAEGRAFWRKEYGVLFSENKPTATPAQLEELSRCEECKGSCLPQRTEGLSLSPSPPLYPTPSPAVYRFQLPRTPFRRQKRKKDAPAVQNCRSVFRSDESPLCTKKPVPLGNQSERRRLQRRVPEEIIAPVKERRPLDI